MCDVASQSHTLTLHIHHNSTSRWIRFFLFFHLCDKWLLGLWELPLETSKNQKNIDEYLLVHMQRFHSSFFFLFLSRSCTAVARLPRTRTCLRSNFYLVLNMFDLNISFGICCGVFLLRCCYCGDLVSLATIRDVLTFHQWAAENRLSPIEVIERFLIGFSSFFFFSFFVVFLVQRWSATFSNSF